MQKFTLKKQIVHAVQWFPGVDVPGGIESPSGDVFIHTPAGKLPLWPGCYVVVGIPGGKVVMGAEAFEAAYEPAKKKPAKKPKDKPASKKKVAKKKAVKK